MSSITGSIAKRSEARTVARMEPLHASVQEGAIRGQRFRANASRPDATDVVVNPAFRTDDFGAFERNVPGLRRRMLAHARLHPGYDPVSPLEDRFRQHGVDALGAVDNLGHVQVHGGAEQHQHIVARQALGGDDEIEHFAGGDLGGLVEVLVQPMVM